MIERKRRYSKTEFASRGIAWHKKIASNLPEADRQKFIAIDIETGEFELHANEMTAAARLRKRLADPQIWLVKAESGFLDRFGAGDLA